MRFFVIDTWYKFMGGDIGEIQLGSERELYKKYINHDAVVKKKV